MNVAKRRWMILPIAVVVMVVAYVGYQLIAVRGTFAPSRPVSTAGGNAVAVGAPGHRIAGRVYVSGTANPAAPVVIVLHGDAPFVKPRYQYLFASELAGAVPGTRVVALLRPGYGDPYGAKSDGDRGFASGTNWPGPINPVVTPPTASSPDCSVPSRCTSMLRAKSKQRSNGAAIVVHRSRRTISYSLASGSFS